MHSRRLLWIAILLLGLPVFFAFAQPREQEHQPSNGEVEAEQLSAEKAEEKKQREEDRRHEQSDLEAQQLAAKSAQAMVSIGWWQLLLTTAALAAAGLSVYYARETFINEARPLLFPDEPDFPLGIVEDGPIPLKWSVTNVGRGAAIIRSYKSWIRVGPIGLDPSTGPVNTSREKELHWPVAAQKNWGGLPVTIDLPPPEKLAIANETVAVYLYVRIRYKGIYRRNYVTQFIYRYHYDESTFRSYRSDEWWKIT